MKAILDTLPPMSVMPWLGFDPDYGDLHGFNHDHMAERDRIVVEHVVRMCAETAAKHERPNMYGVKEATVAILALLEPKP
jgi:hypothetical protein